MLFWRDGAGGRREGLVLVTRACANVDCSCRDLLVEGWQTTDELMGVSASNDTGPIRFVSRSDRGREQRVLWANFDVDAGTVRQAADAPASKPWATEWLRGELDAELLANLRARFADAKTARQAPSDWRKQDWSWWRPGKDVGWFDLQPDEPQLEVEVGGTTYSVSDLYCVEPGCACEEVRLLVMKDVHDPAIDEVGEIALNPTFPTAALFHAHGAARKVLQQVWAALGEQYPVSALLFERRDAARALAPEFHRLFGAPPAPRSAPGKAAVRRNDPCPCGSGLKYKRCCLDKQ